MGFSLIEEEEDPLAARRDDYLRYLQSMTDKTSALGARHFSKDARYQAPFYDVYGRQAVVETFMERFAKMPDYRLKIRASFWEEPILYTRCDAAGTYKGKAKTISFMSEITFDLDGLVCSHIDYYDPLRAFLFDLPVLGAWFKSFYKTLK